MYAEDQTLYNVLDKDISIDGTFAIPNGITKIGMYAFESCVSLKKVIIPGEVTEIEEYAFGNCLNLDEIVIPDSVTTIGNNAFIGCARLRSVTLSKNMTKLERGIFKSCVNLRKIVIPDGIREIGASAFEACISLEQITLPKSMMSIEWDVFTNCGCLKSSENIYKAFKPDLTCREYHFAIGQWSDNADEIQLTNSGYHYCTNLFEIFNYYNGEFDEDFIICLCEIGDVSEEGYEKCVTNRIKPIRKLTREEVIATLNEHE